MSFDYQVQVFFRLQRMQIGKTSKITRLLFEMYLWLSAIAKVYTQGILYTSNEYSNTTYEC